MNEGETPELLATQCPVCQSRLTYKSGSVTHERERTIQHLSCDDCESSWKCVHEFFHGFCAMDEIEAGHTQEGFVPRQYIRILIPISKTDVVHFWVWSDATPDRPGRAFVSNDIETSEKPRLEDAVRMVEMLLQNIAAQAPLEPEGPVVKGIRNTVIESLCPLVSNA